MLVTNTGPITRLILLHLIDKSARYALAQALVNFIQKAKQPAAEHVTAKAQIDWRCAAPKPLRPLAPGTLQCSSLPHCCEPGRDRAAALAMRSAMQPAASGPRCCHSLRPQHAVAAVQRVALGSRRRCTAAAAAAAGATAAAQHAPAAGAAPAADEARYARLLSWASDGLHPVRVAVRDAPGGGGRGLKAEQDVPPGGVLISVPLSRVFTSKVRCARFALDFEVAAL